MVKVTNLFLFIFTLLFSNIHSCIKAKNKQTVNTNPRNLIGRRNFQSNVFNQCYYGTNIVTGNGNTNIESVTCPTYSAGCIKIVSCKFIIYHNFQFTRLETLNSKSKIS